MRLYRVTYYDFAFSKIQHITDAWEGPVCTELKGMLESMGCQRCKIVPDPGPHVPPSKAALCLRTRNRTGSSGSEKEKLASIIPY